MLSTFDMEASCRMHIEFFRVLASLKYLNEFTDLGQKGNYEKWISYWDKTFIFSDTNGNFCCSNQKSDCLKAKKSYFPLLDPVSDKFWGQPDRDTVECDTVANEKLQVSAIFESI